MSKRAEVLDQTLSDPCLSDMSAAPGNDCQRVTVGDDPSVVGHYRRRVKRSSCMGFGLCIGDRL